MTFKPIRTRLAEAEATVETDYEGAIKAWLDWMDRELTEEDQQAFWRACYFEFKWEDDQYATLCGDKPFKDEDMVLALGVMERLPESILGTLQRLSGFEKPS